MRKMEDLTHGEPGIFGPGTDLVVSLAAVLILVLAMKSMLHHEDLEHLRKLQEEVEEKQRGQLFLDQVLESQRRFVEGVAATFGTAAAVLDDDIYAIDIDGRADHDIVFYNHVDRQRITFGSHILFDPDEVELTVSGRRVLTGFAQALKKQIDVIREVHIEGHADTSPTRRHRSNLELAAKRAITVYRTFAASGISPYETIMSATSYGEYLSVKRFRISRSSTEKYSRANVERDNGNQELKRLNRRIEVRLVYTLSRDQPLTASLPGADLTRAAAAR